MRSPFPCDKCGECCKNLQLSESLSFLDSGDGSCRYLDTQSSTCSIYDNRPDICRIDRQYDQNYSDIYTWKEFVLLNTLACNHLKALSGLKADDDVFFRAGGHDASVL